MATKEFSLTFKDLLALRQMYRKAPDLIGVAVTQTLNDIAFETRTALLSKISDQMTIRSEKFIAGRMRVQKAKGRDIRKATAEVGSISTSRFSGWIEQETGKKPLTNRTHMLLARGNSESKRVGPKGRSKSSNEFAKMSQFNIPLKSRAHRIIAFLQMMVERKRQFIMPRGTKGFSRGVYRVRRKKIVQIQKFGPRKVNKEPWMRPVIKSELSEKDLAKLFARNMTRVLPTRLR